MKRVAILGSTGSIGVNTLDVISRYPKLFKVTVLTAFNNDKLLLAQIKKFKPKYVAASDKVLSVLKQQAIKSVKFVGINDVADLVALPEVDIVVIATRGADALMPFLASVKAGKHVAPANKEALVMAGDLLMKEAKRYGATVIPIDSEQSAIFQCLNGQQSPVHRVHLTASGGALLRVAASKFSRMSVKDILSHPRWKMGAKITVDSATLMNKGFEFIEAKRLFSLKHEQIAVLIHPEAIIHSMVEFIDGSLLAQLAITDMRLPIQYALTYPKRLPTALPALDLVALKQLNFERPDLTKFPALGLAFEASRREGTLPAVLNAANEEAVDAFLNGRLRFDQIFNIVEKVTTRHRVIQRPGLADILDADQQARISAKTLIG